MKVSIAILIIIRLSDRRTFAEAQPSDCGLQDCAIKELPDFPSETAIAIRFYRGVCRVTQKV
ncbi:MAG: hypothetical protein BA867_01640 [Desulfobacterales bacterium S5133MH16]|nr:MAG: hypothetical protein BA867_01640 [Desulfobacterales bacterium S5133MH16]